MRSKIAGLVMALSSAALAVAGGCGGSSSGGTAGHGGGGSGGSPSGAAGTAGSTAGTSGGGGSGGVSGAAGATGGAGSGGSAGGTAGGAAGGDGAAGASVPIPDMLAVPTGATLKFRAHGVGAQIYTCAASTTPAAADAGTDAGVTTYAWGPATPSAKLYDDNDAQIGTHFAGPTWMSSIDGSDAVGAKVASVNSPTAGAIPWLMLKVVEHMGTGVFTDVSYVQRVNTAGGAAPATGCDSTTVGTTASIDYTADYYFYTGGVPASDGGVVAQWPFTTVAIPDALATPTGTTLKLRLHGWGAQVYTCTQSGGGDAGAVTYAWGPATPAAKLYDDADTQQGTHSAGPTWTATDTSSIVGTRLQAVNAPSTTSIPWLLLQVASHAGAASGVFSDVTYVQRLNTANGVAPATGCDAAHVTMTTSASYSADYYFYTGVAATDGGADASGG